MTETLVGVNPPSSKDPADPPSVEELAAAKELVRQARAQGVALTGPGGLLKALTKTVIETALEEEMAEHLGYDKHDPLGRNRGNSRNGKRAKTVLTDSGEVAIEVPRDREGSFEPVIVAKRQRRLSSIDEIVLSLYARGLTTGDIAAHFAEIYDAQVSKDTISRITDRVVEEMQAWTSRPLEPVYAAVVLDAINVKVRDGQVANRPVYAAIGVDLEGHKDILGMWFGDGGGESAKFWMVVLTELRNRGVADVFFLVCDGLKGLPDSVNAVWPATIVQTCLIHLIRISFRFASRKYWDKLSRDLKPIYTAVNAEASAAALDDLDAKWGARYPAIIRLWRNAWEEFIPFLDYGACCRMRVLVVSVGVVARAWLMAKEFRPVRRNQVFLMPPDMREWLPSDHLVWFILDTLEALDLTGLEATRRRGGAGAAGFDPRMLLGLLMSAYIWSPEGV